VEEVVTAAVGEGGVATTSDLPYLLRRGRGGREFPHRKEKEVTYSPTNKKRHAFDEAKI